VHRVVFSRFQDLSSPFMSEHRSVYSFANGKVFLVYQGRLLRGSGIRMMQAIPTTRGEVPQESAFTTY